VCTLLVPPGVGRTSRYTRVWVGHPCYTRVWKRVFTVVRGESGHHAARRECTPCCEEKSVPPCAKSVPPCAKSVPSPPAFGAECARNPLQRVVLHKGHPVHCWIFSSHTRVYSLLSSWKQRVLAWKPATESSVAQR